MRAPPVAEKASKKEWQRSKFCERMRAKNFGHRDRRPKRQRRLVGGGHALGTTGAVSRRLTEGLSGVAGPFGDDFCSDSHPFLAPAAASAPLCAGYPGQLMKPPAPTRRARRPGVPNPRPPPILNDRSSIPPLQKRESPAPALSCRGGAPFLLGSALRANLLYWISMLVFLGRTFWAALGTDTCRMPFSKLAWMSSGITLSPT